MRRNYDFTILTRYKYPNLMAEFMETGYSICTLSDHMGHGRCKEDNPVICGKLGGTIEIEAVEAIGLCGLFGCEMEYLFSDTLKMFGDVPAAHIRHYDSNKRQKEDAERFRLSQDIARELEVKPYLTKLMREVLTWTEEQVLEITGKSLNKQTA